MASEEASRSGTESLASPDMQRLLAAVRQAIENRVALLIEYEDEACGRSLLGCLRQHFGGDSAWIELDCANTAVRMTHVLGCLERPAFAPGGSAQEVVCLGDVHKLTPAEQARLVAALQKGLAPDGRSLGRALLATSRGKLKRQLMRRTFRSDLYYRLSENVFVLQGRPRCTDTGGTDLDSITRHAIEAALAAASGNVSAAARRLGISRSTLYRRLRHG